MASVRVARIIVAALVPLAMLPGCTEEMQITLDSTYARPVIHGVITTDTTRHWVRITRSADYFKNLPAVGISGALVSITDGYQTFWLTGSAQEPGMYYTQPDVYGVPGRTYTLSISNVDLLGDGVMRAYHATTQLHRVAPADSISVEFRAAWDRWVVGAYAVDPAETSDFYMFLAHVNGELLTDSLREIMVVNDLLFNGNPTRGIEVAFIEGRHTLTPGDTITMYFCGITEEYFHFLTQVQAAARRQTPLFSGPPANPQGNLSNGAIGIFTAYAISRAHAVVR